LGGDNKSWGNGALAASAGGNRPKTPVGREKAPDGMSGRSFRECHRKGGVGVKGHGNHFVGRRFSRPGFMLELLIGGVGRRFEFEAARALVRPQI